MQFAPIWTVSGKRFCAHLRAEPSTFGNRRCRSTARLRAADTSGSGKWQQYQARPRQRHEKPATLAARSPRHCKSPGVPNRARLFDYLAAQHRFKGLFLHYTFDMWTARTHPHIPFERYADDIICHCKSADEARALWSALADRLAACKLTLHPEKTKIVYCKDANRRGDFPNKSFDFLGFTFRARKTIWQVHIPATASCPLRVQRRLRP